MNLEMLEKIGLTKSETKVYLALLEMGSSTTGPIVDKSKVSSSKIYEILEKLMRKGLASYVIKGNVKYFEAASPERIIDYINEKEDEFKKQRKEIENIIPKLMFKKLPSLEQGATIYKDIRGLKSAYIKLLSNIGKKDEGLFFYIHGEEYAKKADSFYLSIQNLLKVGHFRGISNEEGRKSALFKKERKYINVKFVNFPIPGNVEVCKDRLLLISWENPIIAVFIQSRSISDNFRKYFNAVWKVAKK